MYQPVNTSTDMQPSSKTPSDTNSPSITARFWLASLDPPCDRSWTNKLFTSLLIWTPCQRKSRTKVRRLGHHCPRLYIPCTPKKGPLVTPQTNTFWSLPPKANRCCAKQRVQLETYRFPLRIWKRLLRVCSDPVLSISRDGDPQPLWTKPLSL